MPQVVVVAVPRAWRVWSLGVFVLWWRALRHLPVVVVGLVLTVCELWLRCIAWLPCVLVRFSQNRLLLSWTGLHCLCSFARCNVLSDDPCLWVVYSGEGRLLALLVEVLPKATRCVVHLVVRPVATLVSSPCCSFLSFSAALVGLRVPVAQMVCFVSRALHALPDGGLVTAVGVWLAMLLVEASVLRCVESPLSVGTVSFWAVGAVVCAAPEHFSMLRVSVPQELGPAWPVVPFQAWSSLPVVFVLVLVVAPYVVPRTLIVSFVRRSPIGGFAGDKVGCRSVGPNSEVYWWPQPYSFGWRLPLFGPDLASLDTGGIGLKPLAGYPFLLSLLFFPFPSSPTMGRLPSGDPGVERLAARGGAWERRRGARRRWPCVLKGPIGVRSS
ncbi:hypothetical protein Taro_013635 [Colocasia esculenta]|uniref:Uncharacterized protein n=1 Tax=Colocasia esculenta TaxID=4460 RepID=A0A843UJB4_COLES|nr:hypothetical protein [Colocasia esculenta]